MTEKGLEANLSVTFTLYVQDKEEWIQIREGELAVSVHLEYSIKNNKLDLKSTA